MSHGEERHSLPVHGEDPAYTSGLHIWLTHHACSSEMRDNTGLSDPSTVPASVEEDHTWEGSVLLPRHHGLYHITHWNCDGAI